MRPLLLRHRRERACLWWPRRSRCVWLSSSCRCFSSNLLITSACSRCPLRYHPDLPRRGRHVPLRQLEAVPQSRYSHKVEHRRRLLVDLDDRNWCMSFLLPSSVCCTGTDDSLFFIVLPRCRRMLRFHPRHHGELRRRWRNTFQLQGQLELGVRERSSRPSSALSNITSPFAPSNAFSSFIRILSFRFLRLFAPVLIRTHLRRIAACL
jgi:hypothetical protein